ncbi:MAG: VUT family protein, partial [Pseudomonadota bacterium]
MDPSSIEKIDRADALSGHRFKYYDFAMAAFVAILICSNLIGAAK